MGRWGVVARVRGLVVLAMEEERWRLGFGRVREAHGEIGRKG